uniref:Golgi SNAP receptor complex member 2 n=1 Tax=Acrobeloides nanus TaxID=290746 RepID=A0A914EFI2_9BILA
MENLYHQTNALLEKIRFDFSKLERCMNESEAQPLFQSIHQQMILANDSFHQLDILVNKKPATERHIARQRVDNLKRDYQGMNVGLDAIQSRLTTKWRANAEREELLTQRFRPNETSVNIADSEILLNDRLRQSHSAVDDMIAQGSAVLESLKLQHMNLHGVKRKILDVGQTLGLSGTTLRMIEKRLDEDWLIFVIGAILFIVFMFIFYRWWRG